RPPRPEAQAGDLIKEKDLEQVHLCLGLEGVSARADERYPCALLNVLLGGSMSSRLFQEVREKRGLAYAVYSYLASYSDAGMMGIYLGVDPRRTKEALEVVLEVMGHIGRGVDADELGKAKEHLKGSIFLSAESTDSRMIRMAKNEFNFGRYIPYEEVAARIEAVTPEMVSAVALKTLDPKSMALVALGPGVEKALGSKWYRR
ncbi:MAG: insulinase family protein, partial [Deltaproteobacteria bacterium]|nr:insulinase family protein [Deltaproteobacteria bacterium]